MPNRVALNQHLPDVTRSQALFERARGLIPAGTQTLAKGPTQYLQGVAPKYLARGEGCHVWDVDGNEYIDLKVVPGADSVRFSKTGCDVTTAAVRLARAFTERDRVLCCGYHGWHDWYVGTTGRRSGVPLCTRKLTDTFPYNDPSALLHLLDTSVACVILEPMTFEAPRGDFLRTIKRACEDVGALLVFDEMWTGFRLALGGAQELFDVKADLACFSKAVANGMPLSLLTGRSDVMRLLDDEVFFFTTYGGEALSLAAAQATILEIRERDVCSVLRRQGHKLSDGYERLARDRGLIGTRVVGADCRSFVEFDGAAGDPLLQKAIIQQELLRHGVLWTGFHNLSFSHSDADIEHVLDAYGHALDLLAAAIDDGDLAGTLRRRAQTL